ncbi:MAG: tetratricopeptide repeat protein [Candidatus Aminicenantes bacterium]|nr:tetratricopeptide repeat protein [Candidatus Aminicenantes bacterium]
MKLRKIALKKTFGAGFGAGFLAGMVVIAAVAAAVQDLPAEPFARGKALLLQGKFAEAKASFEQALAQDTKSLDILYYRGVSRLRLDDTAGAQADFSATLAQKPDYALGRAGLAQVWIKQANYAEAEKEIAAALAVDDRCAEAYFQRGVVRGYLKDTDGAIAAFTKSLEIDALHAYAHYYLGLAYNQVRRKDLTIVHLEKFLALASLAPEADQVRNLLTMLKR